MASIRDDRGYNQGFAPSESTRVRMERRTRLLLSEMKTTPETRILEIGCGTGEVAHWMAEQTPARVIGTDLCVPFIEEAKRSYTRSNLEYTVLDFNHPDAFPNASFDYIVGNGIIHHLYVHLDKALASMRRLLKASGRIVFMEPNLYNPYVYAIFSYPRLRTFANLEPDEMAFSKPFITQRLKCAGFTNIRVDYKDFLLPGIPTFLITPSIVLGDVAEQIPWVRGWAQSLFIRADNRP